MKIYCDSSTKEACYIVNGHHPVIKTYKAAVTNNVGEYIAVIYALEHTKRLEYQGVEILTDSLLVVNQVKAEKDGGWKCHSLHLLPFIEKVRDLIWETGATVAWVSREENLAGKVLGG